MPDIDEDEKKNKRMGRFALAFVGSAGLLALVCSGMVAYQKMEAKDVFNAAGGVRSCDKVVEVRTGPFFDSGKGITVNVCANGVIETEYKTASSSERYQIDSQNETYQHSWRYTDGVATAWGTGAPHKDIGFVKDDTVAQKIADIAKTGTIELSAPR